MAMVAMMGNERKASLHTAKKIHTRKFMQSNGYERLIKQMQAEKNLVETGESRTPRPEEATQSILQA